MPEIKFYSRESLPVEMHKVKIVQKLNLLPARQRLEKMKEAGFNTFGLHNIDIFMDETGCVFLNSRNVSKEIRGVEVTKIASPVSYPRKVREVFVLKQQQLAQKAKNGVVMDGRDIGTVVLPDADLKIYQIASSQIRAKRRYEENVSKGIFTPLDELEKEIAHRDYLDMNKGFGALKKAEDAIELDTSYMSIEEVVNFIINKAMELM